VPRHTPVPHPCSIALTNLGRDARLNVPLFGCGILAVDLVLSFNSVFWGHAKLALCAVPFVLWFDSFYESNIRTDVRVHLTLIRFKRNSYQFRLALNCSGGTLQNCPPDVLVCIKKNCQTLYVKLWGYLKNAPGVVEIQRTEVMDEHNRFRK
jgi:hypothetical protein